MVLNSRSGSCGRLPGVINIEYGYDFYMIQDSMNVIHRFYLRIIGYKLRHSIGNTSFPEDRGFRLVKMFHPMEA